MFKYVRIVEVFLGFFKFCRENLGLFIVYWQVSFSFNKKTDHH